MRKMQSTSTNCTFPLVAVVDAVADLDGRRDGEEEEQVEGHLPHPHSAVSHAHATPSLAVRLSCRGLLW